MDEVNAGKDKMKVDCILENFWHFLSEHLKWFPLSFADVKIPQMAYGKMEIAN